MSNRKLVITFSLILPLLIILGSSMNSIASVNSEDTQNGFQRFIEDYPELDTVVVWDISRLKSTSWGEAGESNDPAKSIDKYFNKIDYFDSVFSKVQLVNVIRQKYDPLISAYAYQALIDEPVDGLTDSVLLEAMEVYIADTSAFVYLDFGCYKYALPILEFMLAASVRRNYYGTYYRKRYIISQRTLDQVLAAYRPYCKVAKGNFEQTPWEDWDDFCSYFRI